MDIETLDKMLAMFRKHNVQRVGQISLLDTKTNMSFHINDLQFEYGVMLSNGLAQYDARQEIEKAAIKYEMGIGGKKHGY